MAGLMGGLAAADPGMGHRGRVSAAFGTPRAASLFGHGLVFACIVLPIALFIFKIMGDRDATLAESRRDIENRANIYEQHAQNTFETYQLVVSLLDEPVRGLSWAELEKSSHLRAYLGGLVRDYPQIESLSVIDRDGVARTSSGDAAAPPLNYADSNFFLALREHDGGPVIGRRVRSRAGSGDTLNIARRRSSGDGEFDGVVLVTANPSSFLRFWQEADDGTVTGIFRGDGRLLVRAPRSDLDLTTVRASDLLLRAALASDRGSMHSVSPVDGLARMLEVR